SIVRSVERLAAARLRYRRGLRQPPSPATSRAGPSAKERDWRVVRDGLSCPPHSPTRARWTSPALSDAHAGKESSMRRSVTSLLLLSIVAGAACVRQSPKMSSNGSPNALPRPEQLFTDAKIGRTYEDSKPGTIQLTKAPAGAPNVLLILIDDSGFGQWGTFGGQVPTPNLDRLAKMGLRYTRFHTTALCSPTRAALLTGRNHHSAGTGVI